MFGWAMARAGLPVHFAVFGMMGTGLLLALLIQDGFKALLGVVGDGFRFLYYSLPSDWVSIPLEGSMVKMTNTGRMIRDLERLFSHPDSGVLVTLSIGLYMLIEIALFVLFYRKSTTATRSDYE